jgi:hypothetical protein
MAHLRETRKMYFIAFLLTIPWSNEAAVIPTCVLTYFTGGNLFKIWLAHTSPIGFPKNLKNSLSEIPIFLL